MHRITAAGLVGLSSMLAAPAGAQTALATTVAPSNVVSLNASASMEVPKDQLTVVFSTNREGPDAAQVQSQLKQALDAALAEARKAAKPGGQVEVQTGNFAVYPRYNNRGTPGGWTGSAELIVEGKDMPAIAQLVGRIQTLTVARSSFGLSREAREAVDAEVTAQAIARFKLKAEQVARQFGFGGWALREVQVQGTDLSVHPQPMMRMQASAAPAADAPLPVEAGKTAVTATVSGSVQLSPR
ncbi:MAG: SIMPL domain-containing protein [Proteobacteria bacterium]|nr:SIMPL domain-containing protein [Pseudomonadota bacterium]